MPQSHWGITPRQSIESEAGRRGRAVLVADCVRLLRGEAVGEDLLRALGGPPAQRLTGGPDYWHRVWALRGLLWVWQPSATAAVVEALADESWRVREMAATVAARHRVDEAVPQLVRCSEDANARVRRAGERALQRVVGAAPSAADRARGAGHRPEHGG